MRRLLAVVAACLLACAGARAEQQPCTTAGETSVFLGIQTIRLWPGEAPQAKGNGCEDIPTLTIFDPQPGHGNGSAVVIFPGGAYAHLAANLEGRQVADWFTARGFRAFVLSYRLSSNGYILPVPLLDARRAIQMVRARARDYFVAPNRIVVIGFSAGGHLAALAATQPVDGNAEAEDPIERVSSRPDFLVLGYPWIGAISSDTSNLSYCKLFNVMDRCEVLRTSYSPELFVTAKTPPTFWYHTADDATVPVEQGLRFYEALIKAGVPAEGHIFATGPHGTGLGKGDAVLDQWPNLLESWLRAQGLLTPIVANREGADARRGTSFKSGVEVSINGQGPYRFGMDTGSSTAFLIDPDLARQLSLPVTSHTHLHGFGNNATDPLVDVFRIDKLSVAGHEFQRAIGVGLYNSPPRVQKGQGALGIGLFRDVVVKLDYPADLLSVSDAGLPDADGKTVLAYTDEHLRPIIPAVLGGIPVQARVDSGARGIGADLSIPTELASHLSVLDRQEGKGTLSDILGHSHAYETATLDGDLILGDLVVHRPTLLISDALPYVNLSGIINRVAISIDQRNHRIRLEMPEGH